MIAIFGNTLAFAVRHFIADRYIFPLGWIAAVLLSAYLLNLLLKLRGANADPSAKGCLAPVAVIVGAMLALLIIGLAFRLRILTFAISVITEVTVLFLIPDVIKIALRNWREKRRK